MPQCHVCFAEWQHRLEREPGYWCIRFMPENLFWANAAARDWVGLTKPVKEWAAVVRFAHPRDVAHVEDAYSRAMKLNRPQTFLARAQIHPGRYTVVHHKIGPWRCDQCQHGCGLIVCLCEPLRANALAGVLPPDSSL